MEEGLRRPMKVVFIGSGAFGVPTLRALAEGSSHELMGVLTKPGKPAGRGQIVRQTPVFDAATEYDLDVVTPNSINDDFGQKWLDQKLLMEKLHKTQMQESFEMDQ